MRIDELTIMNFKCFENETFRFNPHFNVVIGKNASGKTSLLDALSIAISTYISGINQSVIPKLIQEREVRTVLIDGQPKPQIPVTIKSNLLIHEKNVNILIEVFRILIDAKNSPALNYATNIQEIIDIANDDLQKSRLEDNKVIFPLIAYYGTGRLWGWNDQTKNVAHFKQREGVSHAYEGWENSRVTNKGFLSFLSFLSWYKTYEDEVNKFKQPEDILKLKVFREIISSMVPEWTDMAYSFKDDDLIGIFKDEAGRIDKLPFSNLSDGYRNMIGMVADMVYRCIQLNPGLKERAVSDTEGIVLIDELDLHLHPEWQRNIVSDLKRVFPKVQFIVTTHSPFIVQSLKKEELIVLEEGFVEDKDPWRKSLEEISEDEMQVEDVPRSSRFVEMTNIAKEYFTLVKQNDSKDSLRVKIDDAKQRLDRLRIRYSDDPAYVAMLETELEKTENNASGN